MVDLGALALVLLTAAGCTAERPARLIAGLSDSVVVNTTRPVADASTFSIAELSHRRHPLIPIVEAIP